MYIKFAVVRENVKIPQRSNPSDSGLDVFFNPQNGASVTIYPNSNDILQTGVAFEIPHGYELKAENRGSWASTRRLIVGAEIIDSGYEGEVFIDLHNIGSAPQTIHPGDKMAQIVMRPVIHANLIEVPRSELYKNTVTMSDRGSGSLGSTDENE